VLYRPCADGDLVKIKNSHRQTVGRDLQRGKKTLRPPIKILNVNATAMKVTYLLQHGRPRAYNNIN